MKQIRKHGVRFFVLLLLVGVGMFSTFVPAEAKKAASTQARVASNASKMIWDYKAELGLTVSQITDIKKAINDFQQQVVNLRTKLQTVETAVQDETQKKADISAIKEKLRESAGIQVDLRVADIETARKIDGILSPAQLAKWRTIQQEEASKAQAMQKRSTGK